MSCRSHMPCSTDHTRRVQSPLPVTMREPSLASDAIAVTGPCNERWQQARRQFPRQPAQSLSLYFDEAAAAALRRGAPQPIRSACTASQGQRGTGRASGEGRGYLRAYPGLSHHVTFHAAEARSVKEVPDADCPLQRWESDVSSGGAECGSSRSAALKPEQLPSTAQSAKRSTPHALGPIWAGRIGCGVV